jgi:hypothetical protein
VSGSVNLLPRGLSEPLEIEDRQGLRGFNRFAQDMRHLLSYRAVLALGSGLKLLVKPVRKIFDVERSHGRFLQSASTLGDPWRCCQVRTSAARARCRLRKDGLDEAASLVALCVDNALPFGGYKQSGVGREMGRAMIDLYTETKSVMIMH